jgi:hypothetical protein
MHREFTSSRSWKNFYKNDIVLISFDHSGNHAAFGHANGNVTLWRLSDIPYMFSYIDISSLITQNRLQISSIVWSELSTHLALCFGGATSPTRYILWNIALSTVEFELRYVTYTIIY